jgi:hypothetical protein
MKTVVYGAVTLAGICVIIYAAWMFINLMNGIQ